MVRHRVVREVPSAFATFAAFTVFVLMLAAGVSAPRAQEARAVGATPPRLSFIDGDVSYFRPGADEWAAAQINTALDAGDSLYAGDGGNLEVEIGTRAWVRAGSGTQIGIDSLETGYLQLRVTAGHAAADFRRLPPGQEIEIDTPNGAFLINHTGYYRFDVDDQSTRFAARRGGVARVVPAGGQDEVEVGETQEVVVRGTETAELERVAPAGDDAWDRWNADRTGGLSEAPKSAQYVSPEVAGVDDLDRYGEWRDTPRYGHVWVPQSVPQDWAPYSTGRWVWDGYYGWTWVDDAPWGWAPYHYGRWCNIDGSWGWAPGPVVAQPVYSPALVAFFGGDHVGVSVSVGTPFVSWVALGWGEPVVPWWGPRGFVGRPYWGGWGGPRVVNNTVINNTTIVNVNNIERYDNFRARNAVIGVAGDRFGRGHIQAGHLDENRLRDLRPVRGELGIRPVRESLVPARDRRGARPPDRIMNRQVVATRRPQDPARLPRASGLVAPGAERRPESRIVTPHGGGRGGGAEERFGGRNVPPPRGGERGAVERGNAGEPRDMRGRNAGERGGAPEPPGANVRGQPDRERGPREGVGAPEERGRHGREAVERGNGNEGRVPPPPPERGGASDRTHGRGRDEVPPPPRGATERSSERARQPEPPQERGRHGEAIDRGPRTDTGTGEPRGHGRVETPRTEDRAPREERHAPREPQAPRTEQQAPRTEQQAPRMEQQAPRMDQRDRAPRHEAREVAPPSSSDGGGRSHGGERQNFDRPQRQPEPQRMDAPSHGRDAGGGGRPAPQAREMPHADRGGGGDHGGGGHGGNPRGNQPNQPQGDGGGKHGKDRDH